MRDWKTDEYRAQRRAYYAANKERITERRRLVPSGHHNSDTWLRKKYDITRDVYDKMLARQGGMCAICGTSRPSRPSFCVDHDHDTGRVRGLLCVTCNSILGYAHDDPLMLDRAIGYLADAA